jgi:alpha-beta hydrolase superfamily lysophospholipase
MTDILIGGGFEKYSTRFRDSKNLIDDVRKKYNNKPVTTLGHSLGASLGLYAGGDKIVAVNRGVGIGGIGKQLPQNLTDIRSRNDIVSVLSNTQHGDRKKITLKTNHINPLREHSHKNLDKLNNKIL